MRGDLLEPTGSEVVVFEKHLIDGFPHSWIGTEHDVALRSLGVDLDHEPPTGECGGLAKHGDHRDEVDGLRTRLLTQVRPLEE
jgi:hypothetical protein